MTTNMSRLIDDASANGYTVEMKPDGMIYILRRFGRWKKPVGIYIYDDGTAFDVTVDLRAARGMRSYKDMRAILGI